MQTVQRQYNLVLFVMSNLVSILIPAYNSARWLPETLASCLNQTWPEIEIIVVDDGSSDNTRQVAESFSSSKIKVLSQKNSGPSIARNLAFTVAQGDFIQYLDADDLLAPDKIEIQMKQLLELPADFMVMGAWAKFVGSPESAIFQPDPIWCDQSPVTCLVKSWTGEGMMPCHSWLTPRGLIERAGPWDPARCPSDDGEFFTRVLLQSKRLVFCQAARCYYRVGLDGSWSSRVNLTAIEACYRAVVKCTEHLLQKEDTPYTRWGAAALYQQFVYDTYPQLPELTSEAEARVATLGGSSLPPPRAGKVVNLLTHLFHWKFARHAYLTYKNRFAA